MDTLNEVESLIFRLIDQTREGSNAGTFRHLQELVGSLKSELEAGRSDRHRIMAENLELKGRIGVLEQQLMQLNSAGLSTPRKEDEFIEHLGAIFVRKPGGRIVDQPLCRQCRAPLKAVSARVPYSCTSCRTFALFRPPELNDVLLTLRKM